MARTLIRVVVSASLVAACGGESQRTHPTLTPEPTDGVAAPDAVLWIAALDGSTDFRIVRRGQAGSEPSWHTLSRYLVSPDLRRIYLDGPDGPFIASLDGADQALGPVGSYWLGGWSPDGERLALLQESAPIIVDAAGVHPVPVGLSAGYAFGRIAWAPDGSRVAFGIGSSVLLATADASDAVLARVGPGVAESDVLWSLAPAWSPGSDAVAVISNGREVVFISPDGQSINNVGNVNAETPSFGWSPDGAWYAARTSDRQCLAVSPSGATASVGVGPGNCQEGLWSPVEARLLFGDEPTGTWSPGDAAPLALGNGEGYGLGWSPDGSIVGYAPAGSPGRIDFVDAHDGSAVAEAPALSFGWNPSGTRLFLLMTDLSLVTADAHIGNQKTIATGVETATWLTDGEFLAVATKSEVFTLRADGTEQTFAYSIPTPNGGFGWIAAQPPGY